jgi:hypothetical protein
LQLERLRIAELGGGNGIAAHNLEEQTEVHHRRHGKPLAPDHECNEQADHDPNYTGTPLGEAPEKPGSIVWEQ